MKSRAFTLIEVLTTISVIGVLASVAYLAVGDIAERAREEKLASDTDTLNRAVQVYLANGGSLANATDTDAVIAQLKSAVSADDARRLPGLSSRLIDPRLSYEPSTTGIGVIWDGANQRFVNGAQSEKAIGRFFFDESLAEAAAGKDSRSATMAYSDQSTWIWDYQDKALPAPPAGSTPITTTSPPIGTTPPPLPPSVLPPPLGGPLSSPVFSISGGRYSLNSYDLPISLENLNPAAISKLVYSVDFGPWRDYTGPITTPPGTTISAQAISLDSAWGNSAKIDQIYEATPTALNPPVINPSSQSFGLFFGQDVTITLIDQNQSGQSNLRYRLDGGNWTNYGAPFLLQRANYPGGVTVEAQSISAGSSYYLPSSVSNRPLRMESLNLTGTASGTFSNPLGPGGMVTNLAAGAASSYFEWGDDNHPTIPLSKSSMLMSGGPFGNVAAGERFFVGSLDYYNGRVLGDTGADSVDLSIALALDINGNLFNPYFDFTFDLINTVNEEDPNNPWPDADFVQVADARASRTLVMNGTEFEFRLEFGETSPAGFASFDQFHVLEEETASAKVYGTFVELGPVGSALGGVKDDYSIAAAPAATTDSTTDESGAPAPVSVYQKEGYVDAEEYTKDLKDVAKDARESAEKAEALAKDSSEKAIKASAEASKKFAEGKVSEAATKVSEAKTHAEIAESAAGSAEDSAVKAKMAASDAASAAIADPSAEKKADEAVEEAIKAVDAATAARQYANAGSEAAKQAAGLLGTVPTVKEIYDELDGLITANPGTSTADALEDITAIILGGVNADDREDAIPYFENAIKKIQEASDKGYLVPSRAFAMIAGLNDEISQ